MRRGRPSLIIMHACRGPSSATSSGSPRSSHRVGSAVLFPASRCAARRLAPDRHSRNPALRQRPGSFLPNPAEWGPGASPQAMQSRGHTRRARSSSTSVRRAHSVAGIAGCHEHALSPQPGVLEEDISRSGIRCRRVSDLAPESGTRGCAGGVCHAQHRCNRNSDRVRSAASSGVIYVAGNQRPTVGCTGLAVDASLPRSLR